MSQAQDFKFAITHESIDGDGTETKTFDEQNQFFTTKELLDDKGIDYHTVTPEWFDDGDKATPDGGDVDAEVVDHTNGHEEKTNSDETTEPAEPEPVETPDVVEGDETNPEDLSKDPIGFLKSVNENFVNQIKGKQAISKQGFRFIQREFEISTQSEVVEWSDEPLGCIVWAKAELPNGYSAEAHGEGYQFEPDVSDNEFVRYADTRAKNRAISDLTSAGALAVSELGVGDE